MKALKQRGWVRSEVDRLKAWALADDLGMIIRPPQGRLFGAGSDARDTYRQP
jgi:hypothetical protein